MKVLINGFYGIQNLGDDYILYSILDTLNRSNSGDKKIKVLVTSQGEVYNDLFKKFKGCNCSYFTKSLKSLSFIKEIICADRYIFGGGGLFPSDSVSSYLRIMLVSTICRIFGTKFVIYGIDINKISSKLSKFIWKIIISNSKVVVLRNDYSYYLLRNICKRKPEKLISSSDITFVLTTQTEKSRQLIHAAQEKVGISGKYILWALAKPWDNEELQQEHFKERYDLLIKQISTLCERYSSMGYQNVFLPFYHINDSEFISDVVKESVSSSIVIQEEDLALWEKRALFVNAHACVSMRFHGVAFSLYHGLPVCAISYGHKTTEMMREAGLSDFLIEYGIRSTSMFYKEFDMDYDNLQSICDKVVLDSCRNSFSSAAQLFKNKAEIAEKVLIKEIF